MSSPPVDNKDLIPLADATAGATGALLTTVILMPVEVAKTRIQTGRSKGSALQVMQQVLAQDGPLGLFKGLHTKSIEVVLRNFLYFYAYEWCKARYLALGLKSSFLGDTACGVLAGVSNLTVTMPIDTLNVRIQTDARSATEVARDLISEGVEGMWSGFGVSSILTVNPAITFAIFDALKARVLRFLGTKKLSAAQAFVLGSFAKVVATLVCYPLMRVKSIMQAAAKPAASLSAPHSAVRNGTVSSKNGAKHGPKQVADAARNASPSNAAAKQTAAPSRGFVRVLLDLVEQEGIAGLYRGCSAQIFTAVAKSGILLSTKEQLFAFSMALVLILRRRKQPRLAGG